MFLISKILFTNNCKLVGNSFIHAFLVTSAGLLGGYLYKIKQDYYRLGEAKASGNLGNTLKVIGKMTFREFPLTMVSPRLTRQDICMDVIYMYIYICTSMCILPSFHTLHAEK